MLLNIMKRVIRSSNPYSSVWDILYLPVRIIYLEVCSHRVDFEFEQAFIDELRCSEWIYHLVVVNVVELKAGQLDFMRPNCQNRLLGCQQL